MFFFALMLFGSLTTQAQSRALVQLDLNVIGPAGSTIDVTWAGGSGTIVVPPTGVVTSTFINVPDGNLITFDVTSTGNCWEGFLGWEEIGTYGTPTATATPGQYTYAMNGNSQLRARFRNEIWPSVTVTPGLANYSTITGTPMVLSFTVAYPGTISTTSDVCVDARITSATGFPDGEIIGVTYNGSPNLLATPYDLVGGVTNVYLSDILGGTATHTLSAHANRTDTWTVTVISDDAGVYPLEIVSVADVGCNGTCYKDLSGLSKAPTLTFADAPVTTTTTTSPIAACIGSAATFDVKIDYPKIIPGTVSITANALVNISPATVATVTWDYNGVASGTYAIGTATSTIYLSTITGVTAPLVGHSNVTDTWTFNVILPVGTYSLTAEPIAQFDGVDYPYGNEQTFQINVNPEPVVGFNFDGDLAATNSEFDYCAGEEVTVTFAGSTAGTAPFVIGWKYESLATGPVVGTTTVTTSGDELYSTTLPAGTYTVTMTSISDANGCSVSDLSPYVAFVNMGGLVSVDVTPAGPVNVCGTTVSQLLTAAVTPVTATVTYQWYNGSSTVGSNTNTYTATASGTYSVVVTEIVGAGTCTETSNSVVINLNPNPEFTVAAPDVCEDENATLTVTAVADVDANAEYLYDITGIGIVTSTSSSFTTTTAPAPGSYDYSVTVTNPSGCDATVTGTFTVNPKPTVSISPEDAEICFGSELIFTGGTYAKASIGTFTWTVDGTEAYVGVSTNTFLFSGYGSATETMDYTIGVTFKDHNGCTATDTEVVTVLEIPVVTINEIVGAQYPTTGGPDYTVFCDMVPGGLYLYGNNIASSVDGCDFEYRWIRKAAHESVFNPFGVTTKDLLVGQLTQTYTFIRQAKVVTCTCASPDWVNSNEITLYVVPSFTASASATPAAVCLNEDITATGTLPTTVSPTYASGVWSATPSTGISFSDVNSPVATVNATVAGTYTLTWTVTNATYVLGCTGSAASTVVTFNTAPVVSIAATPANATVCDGGSVLLTATASNANSYQWYKDGSPIGTATATTYAATTSGAYRVFVGSATCGSVGSNTITVTVNPVPTVSVTPASIAICAGSNTVLTATATNATSYQWQLGGQNIVGATSNTYTASQAGVYTVVVNNTAGCGPVTSNSATVTVNPLPVVTIAAPVNPYWMDNVSVTASHTATGTADYSFTAIGSLGTTVGPVTSSGLTTATVSMPTAGLGLGTATITATVTYQGGTACSASATRTMQVLPPYHAHFSPSYIHERSATGDTILNVPVTMPLSIEFDKPVYTINNITPLPLANIGEYVIFEVKTGPSTWTMVPFSATLASGNTKKIIVTPASTLEYSKEYRLGFTGVYKQGGNSIANNLVVYTHDAKSGSPTTPYVFDELQNPAFIVDNMVYFNTEGLCAATAPTVYPTTNGLCDVIKVEFENPVRYLSGVELTPAGNPHHKFKFQKFAGTWVDLEFDAIPSNFSTGLPMNGPKTITIVPKNPAQMLPGTQYRVVMNRYDPQGGTMPIYNYGFYDLVTGCNPLGNGTNTGTDPVFDAGWTWNTFSTFPVTLSVNPIPGFGSNAYNSITGYFGTVTSTKTVTVGVATPTSITGTPSSEGYKFNKWTRTITGPAGTVTDIATATIDISSPYPSCGQSIAYEAKFLINTYTVTATATDDSGTPRNRGKVTVHGSSSGYTKTVTGIEHGTSVVVTAKAEPGYYFYGWVYPDGFLGTVTNTTTVPVGYPNSVNDPAALTFSTTLVLTGNLIDKSTFPVKAMFKTFYPYVYAAAHVANPTVNTDNNTIVADIVDVEFTTLFVSNILETGTTTFTPDVNTYEYGKFVFGNPDSDGAFYPVTVQPIEDELPCDYVFVKWQRRNFATGVWTDVSTAKVYSFTPTENYRLRAVYKLKDNILVSATAKNPDLGSVAVFNNPLRRPQDLIMFNNTTGMNFTIGTKLYITVFPEPDYYTWRWELGTNTNTSAVTLVQRYEDRSEWEYTVGCENPAHLKAFIDLKEYPVTVRSTVAQGSVASSSPKKGNPGVPAGNQGGTGFTFTTSAGVNLGQGNFQLGQNAIFAATASGTFAFEKWVDNTTGQTISTANPFTMAIFEATNLRAVFYDTYQAPKYNLTLAANPTAGGAILGGQSGAYTQSTTFTLTADAAPGYTFTNWTMTPAGIVSNTATTNLTMPATNVSLTANFVPTVYTVNVNVRTYMRATPIEDFYVVNYGGSVTPASGTFTAGSTIALNATPAPGFRFVSWMAGSVIPNGSDLRTMRGTYLSNNPSYTYTVPAVEGNPAMNIYALFVEIADFPYPILDLTVNSSPAGAGTQTGQAQYPYGVQALVTTQVAIPGYQFVNWTSNVMLPDAYVNMITSQTATANYSKIPYALHVISNNSSLGTVSGSTSPYYFDSPVIPVEAEVLENSNPLYTNVFLGWFTDAAHTTALTDAGGNVITDLNFNFIPAALPVPQTHVYIYAKFGTVTNTFDVTAMTALNTPDNLNTAVGTAAIAGGTSPFNYGQALVISTVANPGYEFQHWTKGGVLFIEQPSFNWNVDGDADFVAVYEAIEYNVTATAGAGGTVAPAAQVKTIGQPVTVTATANTGYAFAGWTATGVTLANPLANPASFSQPANNVSLVANFVAINYNVTATANAGGTVAPAAQVKNYGNAVTVTATPNAGYVFNGWTATGVTLANAMTNPASFTMPANDVTLVADFAKIPYTVTAAVVPANGGSTSALNSAYYVGDAVSVTATPAAGFEFVSWTGAPAGATIVGNVVSFTMPAANVALTATFAPTGNTLSGAIKYFNQFETTMPVGSGFTVGLYNGASLVATSTLDANGRYNFSGIVPGTAYTVKVMPVSTPWGGVSSADALIANYIAASEELGGFAWIDPTNMGVYTPFALNLADVNNAAGVTANDALTILYRTVGLINTFAGNVDFQVAGAEVASYTAKAFPTAPSVLFNYAAGEYAGSWTGKAGATIMNIYFSATGDVNATYIPQGGSKAKLTLNYAGTMNVNVGDEIQIPVTIDQAAQLGAIQLGLTFDNTLIQVTGVEGYEVYKVDNANGTVRIAGFNKAGMNLLANETIVVINAKVLAPIEANVRYFETEVMTEFADVNANPIEGISISTKAISSSVTSVLEGSELIAGAYPNPFKDQASINFTMPEAGKVKVEIYNQFGQLVKTLVNEVREAGVQYSERVYGYDLNGSGTYYYNIVVEGSAKTYNAKGTLILVK